MASPTPNKGYTYPAHGGAVNAWDTPLNTDFDTIDLNLGGHYPLTITSTTGAVTFNSSYASIGSAATAITLPSTTAANLYYKYTGTMTNNQDVLFPAVGGVYVINNASSGAFTLTAAVAGSTTVSAGITQGGTNVVTTDGTDMVLANSNSAVVVPNLATVNGFNTASNLQLNATVLANVLTITAVAADSAATPTAAHPITILFRDATLANGDPVTLTITSALSISTSVGATLGTSNSVPFRFWIVVFNNGGTAALGLINCSTSTLIYPLNESGLASSTAIGAGSTSAGVFYTTSAVTNKAFRIVGFVSYETALATAGTYNNPPDVIQLFGPGVKKPGDTVQSAFTSTTTEGTTSSTSYAALTNGISLSITPTSKINGVRITVTGPIEGGGGANLLILAKNGVSFGVPNGMLQSNGIASSITLHGLNFPAVTTATTYSLLGLTVLGNPLRFPASSVVSGCGAIMQLDEIMG